MASPSLPELLQHYNRPGPRYTSYPTALEFRSAAEGAGGVGSAEYSAALAAAAERPGPLALYVHLPFCAERCLFCGCNVVVTKRADVGTRHLDLLLKEIERVGALIRGPGGGKANGRRCLSQIHWGGGTPTWYAPDQLRRLHEAIRTNFDIQPGAECAIEVDPRVTTAEHLETLRDLGFNRLSLGVQDFDPDVQAAIRRIQPFRNTAALVAHARSLGFRSINLDLIYGLPRQHAESFSRTLEQVIELSPERLALYSYAHVPWMRGHQKKLDENELPSATAKLGLYLAALERFSAAGYEPIGMDHFARPDDELAEAARARTLGRNFMGYTVCPADDIVGCGTSAIGELGGVFFQNEKTLWEYEEAVQAGRLATARGYASTDEDRLRRRVIHSLICRFELVFDEICPDFADHFAAELAALSPLETDGLVSIGPKSIAVRSCGRLFIRNICMVFDQYLAHGGNTPRFSKTI